jgi:hypothetical protein
LAQYRNSASTAVRVATITLVFKQRLTAV